VDEWEIANVNQTLTSYTDNGSGGHSNGIMGTWSFTYDTLNRLTTAQNTAASSATPQYAGQNLCWSYDSFGNRTAQQIQSAACSSLFQSKDEPEGSEG
jgi:hypothetical protein